MQKRGVIAPLFVQKTAKNTPKWLFLKIGQRSKGGTLLCRFLSKNNQKQIDQTRLKTETKG